MSDAKEKIMTCMWFRDGWGRAHNERPKSKRNEIWPYPTRSFAMDTYEEYLWRKYCRANDNLIPLFEALDEERDNEKKLESLSYEI